MSGSIKGQESRPTDATVPHKYIRTPDSSGVRSGTRPEIRRGYGEMLLLVAVL